LRDVDADLPAAADLPDGWKPAAHSRERVLAVMLRRCEILIGSEAAGVGTKARIRHILDNAKAAGVPASDYKVLHFLWRVLPASAAEASAR
jgi:hypothetical protein